MSKGTFKILVVGASGVGKTTLLEQIVKNKPKKDHKKTIGVSFYLHEVLIDDKKYTLQFWDFMQKERFEFLFKTYLKGANAAIIVFDWSRVDTLIYAQAHLKMIQEAMKSKIPFLIVGNKIDLVDDLEWFDRIAIREIFEEEGGFYIECSVNDTKRFEKAIVELIRRIKELELIDVLGNDLNGKILLALNIFSELTLNKLASLTNKSKATLSRYTRSLIKSGLIKSYSKEKEKHPGSIQKKYYALNYDFELHLEKLDLKTFDMESVEDFRTLASEARKKLFRLSLYHQFGKIINDYIENISGQNYFGKLTLSSFKENHLKREISRFTDENECNYKLLNLILGISLNLKYLNEKQYNKLSSLKREFNSKFNEIFKEDDGSEKKYLYIDTVLPILRLMEHEGVKYKKDVDAIKNISAKIENLIQKREDNDD
jgi:small GTP-binding protein